MHTIGQLADAAKVNVETIRYYERQGLIEQPIKPKQGYRQYPQETLTTILFIKRAQQLGFTLAEIASLIDLSTGSCHDVQVLTETKLLTVRQKLKDLKRLKKNLKSLIDECRANPDENQCPIIESLVPKRKA